MIKNTISFKDYPYWPAETLEDIRIQMRQITSTRKDDISTISQITSSFVSGRQVGKIPVSSTDVNPSQDKVGDRSYDANFIYILIDNAGTPEWRRTALSSW